MKAELEPNYVKREFSNYGPANMLV